MFIAALLSIYRYMRYIITKAVHVAIAKDGNAVLDAFSVSGSARTVLSGTTNESGVSMLSSKVCGVLLGAFVLL